MPGANFVTHVPVTFTIKRNLPPAQNRLIRMHWAERNRQKIKFWWLMKATIRHEDVRALKAWRELGLKVKVKMEVEAKQLYDEDNLNALAKWPLDYLVTSGLLRDDSPDCVQFEKPEQRVAKTKALTFRIEPIE